MRFPTDNNNVTTSLLFPETPALEMGRRYKKIKTCHFKEKHNLHIETDNNKSLPLFSRKKNIQEGQTTYLNKNPSDDNKINSPDKPETEFNDKTKKNERHSPLRSQQEFVMTTFQGNNPFIFRDQYTNSPNTKNQKKNQKNSPITLANYWNNKASLCAFGRNANILKTALSKSTAKTIVLLPAIIKDKLKRHSENNQLLDQHYWSEVVEHWLLMDGNARQNHIEAQLRHTIINHNDPRKKLHWQSGVLAARNIPAYCVIAPYAGLYCVGSDILKEKSRFGTNVGRYAVNCSLDNIQICLCGYGHGNITLCINANTTYSDRDPVFKDNACFVVVIYQGWPYNFVVSVSPIKKNHEVLIDYGRHYWKEY